MGKYQAYANIKSSGVEFLDNIPSGWAVLRGKFVFNEFGERSKTGMETLLSVSEYYGVKPRANIIADGDFLSRADSLVDYKKCKKNDLVMNIMLAWKRGLGVTKYDGIVSPAYSVFRFKEIANPDYMHYLLRTDNYTAYFKTRSTGVIDSRLRLYPESFGNVPIILPPAKEQEKIANFLDYETAKIDTLIEKQEQLIKLLKEKRQAVISHAVTKGLNPNAPMRDSGVEWLGDVPKHWEVTRAKFVSTIFIPQRNKPDLNNDKGISWATMEDMKSVYIENTNLYVSKKASINAGSKILYPGAVIASCVGNFGVASINKTRVIINQQLQAFVPKKINAEYLMYLVSISTTYFDLVGTAATLIYVNQEGFENLPVIVPPQSEQQSISNYLDDQTTKFNTLITKCESKTSLLKERKTALISAAVTGKIDVRNWQKPTSQKEIDTEIHA